MLMEENIPAKYDENKIKKELVSQEILSLTAKSSGFAGTSQDEASIRTYAFGIFKMGITTNKSLVEICEPSARHISRGRIKA